MKRPQGFHFSNCAYLSIPLEELEILLGDDEKLLPMTASLMECDACGMPAATRESIEIFLDGDQCIYLIQGCSCCGNGFATAFLDTTDLPEWKSTLLYLLRMQMGLNSLGDE